MLKLCAISLGEFWFYLLVTLPKGSARADVLNDTSSSNGTQSSTSKTLSCCLKAWDHLLLPCSPSNDHRLTAFLTPPWLWSSSTGCLYLQMSHGKRSYSVTAHTAFHPTWTTINSASLHWCAWFWNSNLLCLFVCLFVCCVSVIPCRKKQQHGCTTSTLQHLPEFSSQAAFLQHLLLQKLHQQYGIRVCDSLSNMTWEKQDREEKQDVQF